MPSLEIVLIVLAVLVVLVLIFRPSVILDFFASIFRGIFSVVGNCVGCLVGIIILAAVVYYLVTGNFFGLEF